MTCEITKGYETVMCMLIVDYSSTPSGSDESSRRKVESVDAIGHAVDAARPEMSLKSFDTLPLSGGRTAR